MDNEVKKVQEVKNVEDTVTTTTIATVATVVQEVKSIEEPLVQKELIPEPQDSTEAVEEVEEESDVFITEKDTFDVKIQYYRIDGDFIVESVDDDFDPLNPDVKNISITFKYPSQGDYETIIAQNAYKSPDKMTIIDVMQMELTRIVVLIRKWSLKEDFTRMVELDTKIVKAITNKVREKIGVKGIL